MEFWKTAWRNRKFRKLDFSIKITYLANGSEKQCTYTHHRKFYIYSPCQRSLSSATDKLSAYTRGLDAEIQHKSKHDNNISHLSIHLSIKHAWKKTKVKFFILLYVKNQEDIIYDRSLTCFQIFWVHQYSSSFHPVSTSDTSVWNGIEIQILPS